MEIIKNGINNIDDCIKILNNIIEKCEGCKFATCEQCEISWKEVQSIKIILENLDALCDMQRAADRELENIRKINENYKKNNRELREKVKKLEKENKIFLLEGSL